MMKYFFLFVSITFFLESKSQFYFKPDTLHQWKIDTIFNSEGRPVQFFINGIGSSNNNDTIKDNVQVHTDSMGRVEYIGYGFRDVAATMYFIQGSNAVSSATVVNWLDSTSSLTINTNFITDYKTTETKTSNRRYQKIYQEGLLKVEYEKKKLKEFGRKYIHASTQILVKSP